MRVVGFVSGVLLLAAGFMLGGEVGNMFDAPSLFIGVTVAVSFTLMGHGNDLWQALVVGVFNRQVDASKRAHAAAVLQTLRRNLFWTGFAAALIGAISMSRYMDSWTHFGPAFAVLLLSPFYGIVLAELVVAPIISRLQLDSK